MHHHLKLMQEFEQAKLDGRKPWEFRSEAVRNFEAGDTVTFEVVSNDFQPQDRKPLGRSIGPVAITYVVRGGMLPKQACIFSHTQA